MLAAALKRNTNAPVFVTADRDTLHGSVNRVLDRVRRAGVQRVAFTVDSKPAK
jgi:biopolymer transport protein ExbD